VAARIRLAAPLSDRIGGIHTVNVSADTVQAALQSLTSIHPELHWLIWKEDKLNPLIAVFHKSRLLRPDELASSLECGEEIDIITAVAGG
jgi:molybdopterin converting factor small subunit